MATVMKLYEVPTRKRYEGNEGWITRLFVQKDGAVENAKDFGVIIQDAKVGSVPDDKTLHYHEKQETLFYILSGKCIVNVEGKEYELGPNSALWVAPREIHGFTKVLEDTKILAIVSNPHHGSDVVESKQPWYQEYPVR
jgi:mannose-6-phosphate isomerase-like protein (cupin superfamily)